ncbi:MAG: 50S ribosomal protein L15 [Chloroflexi bacterium]|nr:50S ribosomal protein L15 [Chloroflexota bacterium]MBI3732568.1 50S ribosomal protein L15 [Chloroflexota bacterium]
MKAHELHSGAGATHRKRIVGRGHSAGQGKTSGRGIKGQGARSGGTKGPYFEGGQLPFVRRLPFVRGFTNIWKVPFAPINVKELNNAFNDGDVVTPETLAAAGFIKSAAVPVKVLGQGELQKRLLVQANAFSASAKDKIEKAGGKAEVL